VNKQQLIDRVEHHARNAKSVVDQVEAEGRSFTASERADLDVHLAEAEKARNELKTWSADRKLRQDMQALGDGLGWSSDRPSASPTKTALDHPWTKAFVARFGDGEKALPPAGSFVAPFQIPMVAEAGTPPTSILDLISHDTFPTDTDTISYLQEGARTWVSVPTAYGAAKPQDDPGLTAQRVTAATIPVVTTALPRQYFDDFTNLARWLQSRLSAQVTIGLERQIVKVTFGGVAGTAFTVVSATSITVTAPAHAAGAVDVVVQSPNGNGTLTGGYTYS
jgi:HK97 family phage major capsid protein